MSQPRRLRAVPDRAESAIIYVRVSALMQRGGETFHSPDLQAEAARRMLTAAGIPEREIITDLDVSGRTFAREGLDRVMALARSREITVVALYDLSRLGRNTGEALRHIAELRDLGVRVMSTVEKIDDSPEGQFMLGQFLGMAQLYSDQIGRRWSEALTKVAKDGRWPGVAPIGYRKVDGRLEPDPDLAPAVTALFTGYADGRLVRELAADLGQARGTPVRIFVLRSILDNPIYLGLIRWNGVTSPGQHPALVDEITWQRVRARRARDSRTPARTLNPRHALAGLLVCDACGTAAWVRPGWKQRQPERRYVCGWGSETPKCAGCGTMRVDDVEQAVLAALTDEAARLGARAAARQQVSGRRDRAAAEATRVTAEIGRTETALGALAASRALRELTDTAYQAGATRLEATLDRLRTRLDDAQRRAAAPRGEQTPARLEELLELWPSATDAERNVALRQVVDQVRLRRAAFYREPAAARVTVKLL